VLSFVNSFLLPQSTTLAHQLGFANLDFTNYRYMIYGVILVAMMLFRPAGLIPNRKRRAEMREALTDPMLAAREQSEYEEGAAPT
jgi:branched-chain amino acid transport system permease protein